MLELIKTQAQPSQVGASCIFTAGYGGGVQDGKLKNSFYKYVKFVGHLWQFCSILF
jgi:hypothetical protein